MLSSDKDEPVQEPAPTVKKKKAPFTTEEEICIVGRPPWNESQPIRQKEKGCGWRTRSQCNSMKSRPSIGMIFSEVVPPSKLLTYRSMTDRGCPPRCCLLLCMLQPQQEENPMLVSSTGSVTTWASSTGSLANLGPQKGLPLCCLHKKLHLFDPSMERLALPFLAPTGRFASLGPSTGSLAASKPHRKLCLFDPLQGKLHCSRPTGSFSSLAPSTEMSLL